MTTAATNDKTGNWALHWFRRDLRIHGNPALQHSFRQYKGRVLGFFCFDKKFLARSDFSPVRFAFFLQTLQALRDELRSSGGDLLCLDTGPDEAFPQLFSAMAASKMPLPGLVTWNRDYEPFAVQRDQRLQQWFTGQAIPTHNERDHLIFEPTEIHKDDGKGYSVFTPFSRRWLDAFDTAEAQDRVFAQSKGLSLTKETPLPRDLFSLQWKDVAPKTLWAADVLDEYANGSADIAVPLPTAGSRAARDTLRAFAKKIDGYATARDIPSVAGTSHLSIYLKNGSITFAQIAGLLELTSRDGRKKSDRGRFLLELVWREFYYHVLARNPHVETMTFIEKYRDLAWQNDKELFRAWCEGKTGYPIVDAGMRQLNATGWMHNRVRMIVASFLTKDLRIDYRWGERYFMERLLDGDLAPNNGGWQWAASTGCDPQPYFRIFNPQLQGEKFDPEGDYVRRWVPELSKEPKKTIHRSVPEARGAYPGAIVDHKVRRDEVLEMYRQSRGDAE